VEEYGERLAVVIYCSFEGSGVEFAGYDEDALETLADLLVKVRGELIDGDTSFLEAVVSFYGGEEDEDEDEDEEGAEDEELRSTSSPAAALDALSKGELQQQCEARGIAFRKSWSKAQLREALAATAAASSGARPKGRKPRLSRAARRIINELERV